jgi:hypothetical protein
MRSQRQRIALRHARISKSSSWPLHLSSVTALYLTVTFKLVLCVILPLFPMMVTVYAPPVVPEVPIAWQFGEPPTAPADPPPQPVITLIPTAAATSISSPRKSRLRATGSSRTQSPASASPATRTLVAPPVDPHVEPVLFAAACDVIVTTALALGAAALSTSVAGLTVQPGSSAAAPVAVTEQVNDTMPVNSFDAVPNTVTVFPVVAPAVTLSDPGLDPIEKLPVPVAAELPPAVKPAAISFAPSTEPQPVD